MWEVYAQRPKGEGSLCHISAETHVLSETRLRVGVVLRGEGVSVSLRYLSRRPVPVNVFA